MVIYHYYESGTNVFDELAARGIQYVSTTNQPGYPYNDASPQLLAAPYRKYGLPGTNTNQFYNVYIGDFVTIAPGNPLNGTFFDFLTEVRGSTYDLQPNRAVSDVIATGTTQLKTALDSMVPGTLFMHEYELASVSSANWSSGARRNHQQYRFLQPNLRHLRPGGAVRPRTGHLDDEQRHFRHQHKRGVCHLHRLERH